uniref:TonB-dependent receptor, plug n=1 Tax=Solibacter usitatus (strain Ellin6076) TaxID=234267 RepID=Q02CR2_SOLUE
MNFGPLVPVFLAIFLCAAPLWAQRSAYVFGRIFDPSGASVPEAAITVVDQENGFRRTTQSDPDGSYMVASLEPGLYKVTVRKDGFVGMMRFDVKVSALAPAHADFSLKVGAVQETITVEGTAPLLSQEESSIGLRVFREDIQRIPVNGRGILGLLEFSPGTNITPATRGEAGQFSANGQRPNANYFTVDGASANTGVTAGGTPAQATGGVLPAMSAFGSLDSLLPLEAVDEFHVQTATSVSEPGRLPGASVSLSSRSGSNEFHASMVYRLRHETLAANDWFANVTGESRGPLRLHDLAPSLGGPLLRNRTFFFVSYQHLSLRGSYVFRQPVPSDETRAAAPDWVKPALDLYPQANGDSLGNGLAFWSGRNIRPSQLDTGTARIDHALTSRATLFARYNDSPSFNEFGSTEVNRLDLRFRSLTLGVNYRPGANWTIDFRANESQAEAQSSWAKPGGPILSGCDLEPLTSYLFPSAGSCDALVRFSIGGVGQVVTGREGTRRQRQFQMVESTGWKRGAQSFRMGMDFRRMKPVRRDATGVLSVIADDLSALADKRTLWLGSSPPLNTEADVTELSLWLQDTWQVSSRLTITPGLRWEFNPSPEPAGTTSFFHPETGTVFSDHRPLWPVVYNNFAPRLGAAWRVRKSGRTILRAGGGIFYDSSLSIATDLINGGPLSVTQFTNGRFGIVTSLLSYAFAPRLLLPRLGEWNFTLDQQLGTHDALSVSYVGSVGHRLLRREIGGIGNSITAQFAVTTNHGASAYQGLQAQYRRRLPQGLQVLVSYSWAHALDNDSSDSFLVWTGVGSPAARDHASSDFDLRHTATATLTYDFPVRHSGAGRWVGGWAIDSVARVRSGFPISVVENEQYQGVALANAFRPDQLLNQPVWIDDESAPGGRRLNVAAFLPAAPGVQGSLGRNSITGFGMSQIDLAIRRDFRWKERYTIGIRLEAFNVLNQANFADPVRYMSSPVFGQSTSMLNLMLGTGSPGSGLAPTLQTGGPRSLQGSLRFRF